MWPYLEEISSCHGELSTGWKICWVYVWEGDPLSLVFRPQIIHILVYPWKHMVYICTSAPGISSNPEVLVSLLVVVKHWHFPDHTVKICIIQWAIFFAHTHTRHSTYTSVWHSSHVYLKYITCQSNFKLCAPLLYNKRKNKSTFWHLLARHWAESSVSANSNAAFQSKQSSLNSP